MERRNESHRASAPNRRGRLSLPVGTDAGSVQSFDIDNTDELLTVAETAKFLKISVTGVRRLQQRRLMPFIKVGGSLRFARSDLRAYIVKRRVEAIG